MSNRSNRTAVSEYATVNRPVWAIVKNGRVLGSGPVSVPQIFGTRGQARAVREGLLARGIKGISVARLISG